VTAVVLLVARGEVRRTWRSLLALALIVALVGSVVLAVVAGTRRTASVLDRARADTESRDVLVQVDSGDPVIDRVADAVETSGLVEELTRVRTFVTEAEGSEFDFTLRGAEDGRYATTIDRPVDLRGRLPAPDAAEEVVLNTQAADQLELEVGDSFDVGTFAPGDVEALFNDGPFPGFNGPRLQLEVVGIARFLDDLQGGDTSINPVAVVGPAFFAERADEVGSFPPLLAARLADGATVEELEALVERQAGDADVSLETAQASYGDSIDRAVHVLTVGLIVFSVVAGLAGALVVGQAVSRQVQAAAIDDEGLRQLGVSRSGRTLAVGLPVIGAVVAGAVVAAVGSVLASPLFPIGLAREAETAPGLRFDPLAAVGGAALLAVVIVALVLWRSRRRPTTVPVERVGPVRAAVTRSLGGGTVSRVGARLALDPGRGSRAVPLRSAVVGAALGVVGVVGVAVVVGSLHGLVHEPARWGWSWSSVPDLEGDPAEPLRSLATDDRLDGVAALDRALVDFGAAEVSGYALRPIRGDMALTIREGRAPTAPDEVALGHRTAEALGVSVGDRVRARTAEGEGEVELAVVGEAVLPIIDNPSPGEGAWLTQTGLDEIRRSDGSRSLLLSYPAGADTGALEDDLTQDYGLVFSAYARPNLPGDVSNLDGIRTLTIALGAFFAVLAVVGLAHALAVSTRRRRVDFAVLRTLGFRRREVRQSIEVQAVLLVLAGLVIGIPIGLVVGRVSWRLMVESIGVIDDPAQPWGVLIVSLPAAVVAAVAVALVPAWRAARLRPAQVLRSE
jgi:putative ABC transport system permease protein